MKLPYPDGRIAPDEGQSIATVGGTVSTRGITVIALVPVARLPVRSVASTETSTVDDVVTGGASQTSVAGDVADSIVCPSTESRIRASFTLSVAYALMVIASPAV